MRPSQLDHATRVGKDVAYRVLKAVRSEDPIAVVHLLPGPTPLRRLLRAATDQAVSPPVVAEANQAVDALEEFIAAEAGDRGTLDLIISGWLPQARHKGELLAKQTVFRGMSQIKGLSGDVLFEAAFACPSADGTQINTAWVRGVKGFRRWRRGVELHLSSRRVSAPVNGPVSSSLDGRPITGVSDWILPQFSSVAAADLEVARTTTADLYTLRSDTLGMRSAEDIVFAEVMRHSLPRYEEPGVMRRSGLFSEVVLPARLLVFDVLLHAEAFPEAQPQLRVYDTGLHGVADCNDATRDRDILPLNESISAAGKGVDGLRVPEVPQYVDIMRHVLDCVGWDAQAFRAFRCRIEYPLYASQVIMTFERPPLRRQ
ncbi:MAG: hypothetical protein PVJ57_01690 [Phycisphaerae bacterium]|jgi:hypothetical protein